MLARKGREIASLEREMAALSRDKSVSVFRLPKLVLSWWP